MRFIIMVLFSYIIAFILYALVNKNKKISSYSIVAYILTGLFFFSVIVIYFFIFKFNGDANVLLFPDERVYLFNVYELGFFDIYIKTIYQIAGIELVKAINVFAFFLGQLIILNQIKFNGYTLRNLLFMVFIVVSLSLFSYWTYFVLKEAFTFLGFAFYLSYQESKKVGNKIAAYLILFVTRLNLFVLIIGIDLLSIIYYKIKKKVLILVIPAFFSIVLFMNSPNSYSFKLGILARRYGAEVKEFDAKASNTANKGFFAFVFSEEYFQAIITNLNETFNPIVGGSMFIKMMILINFIGLLYIMFYLKPKFNKNILIFYSIIILLISTHSTYRYINAIILPFCIYFYVHKNKSRGLELL